MRYGANLPFGVDLAPEAPPLRHTLITVVGRPGQPQFAIRRIASTPHLHREVAARIRGRHPSSQPSGTGERRKAVPLSSNPGKPEQAPEQHSYLLVFPNALGYR
jgi:hypothetical protein